VILAGHGGCDGAVVLLEDTDDIRAERVDLEVLRLLVDRHVEVVDSVVARSNEVGHVTGWRGS